MWEDPGYSGSKYVSALPENCPTGCEIDGWDGDNEISSVKNTTKCKVRLYANDGYGGDYRDIAAFQNISNLEHIGFDNDAESFKFFC